MIFGKKITIFKKKDKESWTQIKDVLKSESLKFNAGHYFSDSLSACGCGSKLDPRNFGAKGKIDRDIYYVDVKESDAKKALEILSAHGIIPEVDSDPVGKLGRML